jgi:hypothetical protein
MRALPGVGIVLLLACAAGRADDSDKKKPDTPKAQYDALQKEYGAAQTAFFAAIQKVEDPHERQKVMKKEAPKLEKVLARFVELADKNPKDPVAVDALAVVVQDNLAAQAGGASRKKAIELLRRDHLASDKLGTLCQRLGSGFDGKDDELLRAVLDKNPSKAVQAEACLALMQSLGRRAEFARRVKEDESLAKQVEEVLGKETLEGLKKTDAAKLDGESEKLTKQFTQKYVGELKTDRLTSLCQRVSFDPSKANEALLRKLAANDKDEVKGVATLCLAQLLKLSADGKAEKDAKAAEAIFKESETLFERAAEKYADVKLPFRGTVGKKAKSELYELRNLRVGKTAPPVEGEDQDGKKFKLSDYQGKVVLLDFWSQF